MAAEAKPKPTSRMKRLIDGGQPIPLPEINVDYILAYLWEVGPTISGGMGEAPLSHAELLAWQTNVGIDLQPWESRMLRRLSVDYLVESQNATEPDCPAPFGAITRRIIVAKKLDDFFG
jgi:hypothetical protein